MESHIGLIGLAVMGSNLARNIADKKYRITVYNRTTSVTEQFMREFGNKFLVGANNLKDFVASLERPRKIIIMVKAGTAVDTVIAELSPLLSAGDIIVDCGNSFYRDTARRFTELQAKGIHYIGSGVSGGEVGALLGPSLMPGGARAAYRAIEPIWKKIAAKDFAGSPCVTYVGDGGAGHYVKMVHNGIEYGIMQLIAEAYDILRTTYRLNALEISKIFNKYNKGVLESYLFEITSEVLARRDDLTRGYLIDHIRDAAGQKGTGKWTSVDSLDRGIALPTITEAVFARCSSAQKDLRTDLAKMYKEKITAKKTFPKNVCEHA
jgi:6-phosphogluconate dehydrogenase